MNECQDSVSSSSAVALYSAGCQRDGARRIQLKRTARLANRRHALIMTGHRTTARLNHMRIFRNPLANGHALLGLITQSGCSLKTLIAN